MFVILLIIALALTGIRAFTPAGFTFFGLSVQGVTGKIIGGICFALAAILLIWTAVSASHYK